MIERAAGHHAGDEPIEFISFGLLAFPGEELVERHQLSAALVMGVSLSESGKLSDGPMAPIEAARFYRSLALRAHDCQILPPRYIDGRVRRSHR